MAKPIVQNMDKIEKRLDLIAVMLLARSGFTREEIADMLDMSTKTIERMFRGRFRQLQKEG